MTGDPRTTAAVDELWARTVAHPEDGLTTLFETVSRRRRQSRVRLATATVVAVVAAWWGFTTLGDVRSAPPAPSHQPLPTRTTPGPCHTLYVTCLGNRTYRFSLYRPVTWRIPQGYGVNSGSGLRDRVGGQLNRLRRNLNRSGFPGLHSGSVLIRISKKPQ